MDKQRSWILAVEFLQRWQWGSPVYGYNFHSWLHRGTEHFTANKTRKNKTPKQTANETLLLSLQQFNLHSESQREERSVAGCLLPAAEESGRGPWRCDGFYLMKINNTPSSRMCRLIWIFIFTVNGTRSEWLHWGKNYHKLSDLLQKLPMNTLIKVWSQLM